MTVLVALAVLIASIGYLIYKNYLMHKAWIAYRHYAFDRAHIMYNRVVKFYPRNVTARVHRGWFYEELGQPQKALDDYETALRHQPRYIDAHLRKALLLANLQRFVEAEEQLQIGANAQPDEPNVNLFRSMSLLKQDKLQAAYDLNETAYQQLGLLVDKYAQFGAYLSKELSGKLTEQRITYHLLKASIFSRWQNFEAAHKEYDKALEMQVDSPYIYNDMGETYFAQGDYTKALESFQQAKVLASQLVIPLQPLNLSGIEAGIATSKYKLGDSDGAKRIWKDLIRRHPGFSDVKMTSCKLNWAKDLTATLQQLNDSTSPQIEEAMKNETTA